MNPLLKHLGQSVEKEWTTLRYLKVGNLFRAQNTLENKSLLLRVSLYFFLAREGGITGGYSKGVVSTVPYVSPRICSIEQHQGASDCVAKLQLACLLI